MKKILDTLFLGWLLYAPKPAVWILLGMFVAAFMEQAGAVKPAYMTMAAVGLVLGAFSVAYTVWTEKQEQKAKNQ